MKPCREKEEAGWTCPNAPAVHCVSSRHEDLSRTHNSPTHTFDSEGPVNSCPFGKSPLAAKAVRVECGRAESLFPENRPKSSPHGIAFQAVPHRVDVRRKRRHFDRYKGGRSTLFIGRRSKAEQFLGEGRVHLESKPFVRHLQVQTALLEPPRAGGREAFRELTPVRVQVELQEPTEGAKVPWWAEWRPSTAVSGAGGASRCASRRAMAWSSTRTTSSSSGHGYTLIVCRPPSRCSRESCRAEAARRRSSRRRSATRASLGSEGIERAPRRTRTTASTPRMAKAIIVRPWRTTRLRVATAKRIPATATMNRTVLRHGMSIVCLFRIYPRFISSNESGRFQCIHPIVRVPAADNAACTRGVTTRLLQAFKWSSFMYSGAAGGRRGR